MSKSTSIINRGPSKIQIIEEQIESLENELITVGQNASVWQIGHIKVAIKKLKEKRNKLLAEKDTTKNTQNLQQIMAAKNAGAGLD